MHSGVNSLSKVIQYWRLQNQYLGVSCRGFSRPADMVELSGTEFLNG